MEQQLQHHDWTALAAFNAERRQLVRGLRVVLSGVCVAAAMIDASLRLAQQHQQEGSTVPCISGMPCSPLLCSLCLASLAQPPLLL